MALQGSTDTSVQGSYLLHDWMMRAGADVGRCFLEILHV